MTTVAVAQTLYDMLALTEHLLKDGDPERIGAQANTFRDLAHRIPEFPRASPTEYAMWFVHEMLKDEAGMLDNPAQSVHWLRVFQKFVCKVCDALPE